MATLNLQSLAIELYLQQPATHIYIQKIWLISIKKKQIFRVQTPIALVQSTFLHRITRKEHGEVLEKIKLSLNKIKPSGNQIVINSIEK